MGRVSFLLALAAGGALTLASGAAAQTGPGLTRAALEEGAARAFARLDGNGDGRLDQQDRAARRQGAFDRLDADGDGALSPEEFGARRAAAREARREGGDRLALPMARQMLPALLAARGEGGFVAQADFVAAALALFDRADADGDGILTRAERRAAAPAGERRDARRALRERGEQGR